MGCCFSSQQEPGPAYSHPMPQAAAMREQAAARPLQHYPSVTGHGSRSAHHRHPHAVHTSHRAPPTSASASAHHRHSQTVHTSHRAPQTVHTSHRAPPTSTAAGHARQPTLSRGNAVRRPSEHRKLSRKTGSVSRSSAPPRYCRGRDTTAQMSYVNASISTWDPTPTTRREGSKRRKASTRDRSISPASTVSRESAPDCTLNRMATTGRVRRTYGLPPRKREIHVDERDVFGQDA